LFNIRVAGTAVLVFLLAVVTFSEVILSREFSLILYRSSVFVLVLSFGILLIRGVLREVERKEQLQKLSDELKVANEKLKELDKAKTEFVSMGSHQLRAPLTAIKGYASLVLEGSFGEVSDKVKGAVEVIFQSSQKLVQVIEDFLNITRIELGRMKYAMEDFDFKQTVERVINELRPGIERKGLAFSFAPQTNTQFKVNGDQGKLSQVVSNLIDNAVKYTPKGSVGVSLRRESGKVRLEIKDTGVGMEPHTIEHLFQKFTRADDAGKVNLTGTGLGLYVAKQIVEAHNGKIWVESAGPGQGSTFIVEI
jgi:signal transduction histidine kinase